MSFCFNFSVDDALGQLHRVDSFDWYPSEEVFIGGIDEEQQQHKWAANTATFQAEGIVLKYLNRPYVLESLNSDPSVDSHLPEAEQSHSDLVPGKYEGGLKIWECSYDIAEYVISKCSLFEGKDVLDLGCGSGLLGLIAFKLNANSIHFQDYNRDVLKHWTIPNVLLNGALPKSRFWSGDWKSFAENFNDKYDIILSSETIYNLDNQPKICSLIEKRLKIGGVAFIAGKSYYFGVGGSMQQFESFLLSNGKLCPEVVWKSSHGIKREIMQITWRE